MKILREIFLLPVHIYRLIISPLKGGSCCGYSPTCSQYFLSAVRRHGVLKGTVLGAARILRCRPSFFGGYDPVPEEFSWEGIRNEWKARKKPKGYDSSFLDHGSDK